MTNRPIDTKDNNKNMQQGNGDVDQGIKSTQSITCRWKESNK